MPLASFLIPVRDAEATLPAALESVAAQTVRDWEAVVVDDGSSDASAAVAAAFVARDPRFRLVRQPPLGIVAALDAGLAAARAPLVARLDADDLAAPDRLERALPALAADPSLVLVDGLVEMFRDDGPVPEGMARWAAWIDSIREPEDFDREILVESPVVHPGATFRLAPVRAVGGYRPGDFPEDYDLWLRLHAAGGRFRRLPHLATRMRDRPARLTRTDPRYRRDALRSCKFAWLASTVLAAPRRVVLWGAGREGRPWLRWLRSRGCGVVAVLDIDPRKIGRVKAGGVPVLPTSALPGLEADLLLAAVSARDARPHIRRGMAALRPDWSEGVRWWCVS